MRGHGLFILALNIVSVVTPALSAEAVQAWIDTEWRGANLIFTGFVQANAGVEIRYELTAVKSGKSGQSRSQQAGRFRLQTDAPRRLAESRFNVAEGDDYCVQLAIYQGSTLVASQIITPPDKPSPESCKS
jgi:hypothetical protein